jgi:hypothetical protein
MAPPLRCGQTPKRCGVGQGCVCVGVYVLGKGVNKKPGQLCVCGHHPCLSTALCGHVSTTMRFCPCPAAPSPPPPEQVLADAVIIATGAAAKRLKIPGCEEGTGYWQKGISACAVCDGASPAFR